MINEAPDVISTWNYVFGSTTFPVPIPGIANGDATNIVLGQFLLLGFGFFDDMQTGVTVAGGTSGTTWFITPFLNAGSNQVAFNVWKIADAGDVADSLAGGQFWTGTCTSSFIMQGNTDGWSGVDQTSPFLVGPSEKITNTTTPDFNSITATATGQIVVLVAQLENNSSSQTADPTGVTLRNQSSSGFYFAPNDLYTTTTTGSGALGNFPGMVIGNAFQTQTEVFILNPASSGATPSDSLFFGCGTTS